jgi:hypothetical protein
LLHRRPLGIMSRSSCDYTSSFSRQMDYSFLCFE